MPFESGHTLTILEVWTPLMSVFGVRKEFLDVNMPNTSISASAVWVTHLTQFEKGILCPKS